MRMPSCIGTSSRSLLGSTHAALLWGAFALVLRLLVVTAAIGGLVAPDAVAKSFPPRWPQSPGTHAAGAHLAPRGIASPVYASNLRGGYAIVGNTLLTCPENLLPAGRRGGRLTQSHARRRTTTTRP